MQHTKKLTSVLRSLLSLIEDEANRNQDFANRLEQITSELPRPASVQKGGKNKSSSPDEQQIDVMAALQSKGEDEYRFWLRDFELLTLKKIIKINGFDPGKKSQRWTEPDKLIDLIVEQTSARLRRGAAFLPQKSRDFGNVEEKTQATGTDVENQT
jgi:hypothetical protein